MPFLLATLLAFTLPVLPAHAVCAWIGARRLGRAPGAQFPVAVASLLPWCLGWVLVAVHHREHSLATLVEFLGYGGLANVVPLVDLGLGNRGARARLVAGALSLALACGGVAWSFFQGPAEAARYSEASTSIFSSLSLSERVTCGSASTSALTIRWVGTT